MKKILKYNEVDESTMYPYEPLVLEELLSEVADEEDDVEIEEEEIITREMILEEARGEAAKKVQEAYEEGVRRGFEAGKAEFEESVGQAAQALEALGVAMSEERTEFLESLESQVVQLVKQISAAVVAREVRTDPDLIHTTVRKALQILLDRERTVLRIHPGELEVLRASKIALLEEYESIERLELQPDDTITQGGCVAESKLMSVDASIERQLERVLNALTDLSGPTQATDTHDKNDA